MSIPENYQREHDFTNDPPDQIDRAALNTEYDRVGQTLNSTVARQALLLDDDDKLRPGVVGFNSLSRQVQLGLYTPGPRGPIGPQGGSGPRGQDGPVGPVGASYRADLQGLLSERAQADSRPKGYSFMAIDVGFLYFKLSSSPGDWSAGFAFGRGDRGSVGPQGGEGPRGLQGLRGLAGPAGPTGPVGPTGPATAVDYGRVVVRDSASDQTMQGGLSARTFVAAMSASAPEYRFSGAPVRLVANNTRVRVDTGGTAPTLAALEVSNLHTSGTGAQATGVKLANGNDLGTLFDPAGSAASKLASVDQTVKTATLTGRSTISVRLVQTNNQVSIEVTTS